MASFSIPPDDRGLLLGDGLFETVLFKAGEPVLWEAHLARLARGCAVLGLPPPDPGAALAAACAAAAELTVERAAVRLTWTAGSGGRGLERPAGPEPRLLVSAAPSARPAGPARAVLSSVRRNAGSPASRIKSLSYLDSVLARREAVLAGADEALMLNGAGHLASAAAANLFWARGGRLFTPALECGVLDGIMRAQVMAARPVEEAACGPEALRRADALFLTNSLIGVREVASLDGRAFPGDSLVRALQAELAGLA